MNDKELNDRVVKVIGVSGDYVGDLNLAHALLDDCYCSIQRNIMNNTWRVRVGLKQFEANNKSLSRAICEAWLSLDNYLRKDTELND